MIKTIEYKGYTISEVEKGSYADFVDKSHSIRKDDKCYLSNGIENAKKIIDKLTQ